MSLTFAATIGAYELASFVELNIRALRRVFGDDLPILVSDDLNRYSAEIRDVASRFDVFHYCSDTHRGHFAGDVNQACNALAFAKAQGADIALKISQRFILCDPICREILERYFSDPEVWLAFPGKIHPSSIKRAESRFFSNFSTVTDFFAVRPDKLSAETVKNLYETRVREQKTRFDTLAEPLWSFIGDVTLAGHTIRMPEFSSHYPGRPPIYLRKCQQEPADYQVFARENGMDEFLPLLVEWRQMSTAYRPVPQFI